ncbi:hypothetical protein SteCoe_15195 [Stentor coeruleus]|uniref:Uncharacterized protein n=1 Tax=Stentor coeruleus TaxID=5963 RepID=A0A1R2C466_9CILI|nr:hypothetical protein SteCoe_15195 [Stentor coeruleus]
MDPVIERQNWEKNSVEVIAKLRKISVNLVWKSKCHDLNKKCAMLEEFLEEIKKKSKKDNEIWELETEHSRKIARKLDEEVYICKKNISELEGIDALYKKELIEKEKLVKALDVANKDKKSLEDIVEINEKRILELIEVNQKNNLKDLEENYQIIQGKLLKTESKVNELTGIVEENKKINDVIRSENLMLSAKTKNYEEKLTRSNDSMLILQNNLQEKIDELNNLKNLFENYKTSILNTSEQKMIDFKIYINTEESLNDVTLVDTLRKKIEDLETKISHENFEKKKLKFSCKELESQIKQAYNEKEQKNNEFQAKISSFENQILNKKAKNRKLLNHCTDLEKKIKENSIRIQDLEYKLNQLITELVSKNERLSIFEQDSKSYNDLISNLNQEKSILESSLKQKEARLKFLAAKINNLENQVTDKTKELLTKENELINSDMQIDILKKKINSNTSRIKQIASDQIGTQKKKIESFESEIKMLKDMLKSVQSELKYKQQEILKIKKSPKKKELPFEGSPLQIIKARPYVPEIEIKSHAELLKNKGFKKSSFSIFKARSPFKISSKKNFNDSNEVYATLEHIVKGYLTSFILCEKEKKELLKYFKEEDHFNLEVLDKNIIKSKCDEAVLDTSILNIYGNEVDYKHFVEMNYQNQIQQIRRDLEINFSQILPGTISISELKLIRLALRPLHQHIWDVIVERISGEFKKEVDLYFLRQILSQTTISL